MSKTKQAEKNFKLSEKLAEYIASNPAITRSFPSETSFVVFSSSDKKLNRLNSELSKSLKDEGKKVVKVTQKRSKEEPWTFSATI